MSKISWNRTKIVATLGPATSSYKIIKKLILSGVDVVRLNFSHGTIKEHVEKIRIVRPISQEIARPIAVLADLPGPKLRVGHLSEPKRLIKGKEVVLSIKHAQQNYEEIPIRYSNLPGEVKRGTIIFLDDGGIKLRVLGKNTTSIRCKVLIGGLLKPEAGINVQAITLKTDFLTRRDKGLISFSIKQGVDLLAFSFVRRADDVKRVRSILRKKNKDIFLISKIEKHEALQNIDIVNVSDGIMVARGDLGVELPIEKVALIQKSIIKKCNKSGKHVITATQMLEFMIHHSKPTRAEVTDISNAILDGTDAVMLSGETAVGKYPLEAVKAIVRIAAYVENSLDYNQILSQRHTEAKNTITDIISFSACESALHGEEENSRICFVRYG